MIYRVYYENDSMQRESFMITHKQVSGFFAVGMLIFAILLCIWATFDAMKNPFDVARYGEETASALVEKGTSTPTTDAATTGTTHYIKEH